MWGQQSIAWLGRTVFAIAVVILVYDRTGSGLAVAGILLAPTLASFVAPLTGVISDRADRRVVMLVSYLAGSLFVLATGFAGNLAEVFVLATLAGLLAAAALPAQAASLPELVRAEDLMRANSLMNLGFTGAALVGSVLGGALVALIGSQHALLVDATFFVGSAGLAAFLPPLPPRASTSTNAATPFWQELRGGLRYAASERVPAVVISAGFLLVLFAGSTNAVTVILAKDELDGGDAAYGLLKGAWASGMLIGSLGLVAAGARARPRAAFLLSLLLDGAGIGLAAAAPGVGWAAGALAIGGLGNGLDSVSMSVLLQQAVPNELRARILSLSYASLGMAQGLALALGGGLAQLVSARFAYLVASIGLFGTLAYAWALLGGLGGAKRLPVAPARGP